MGIRSLVLRSFAATVFCLAPSARADIPNPTGSGGGTTSTGGTGGTSAGDHGCTVAREQVAGSTCQVCNPSSSCSGLGSEYNLSCTQSATVAVYCNGPKRLLPSDQNVACSVAAPGAWGGAAASCAFAAAAALMMRRRRRS